MLIERLVFGCARLTGGFCAREAQALVERALAGGVTRFDTAPSYGMGTAEAMIGRIVGNDQAIAITAKVGSSRPRLGLAKSAVRRARRALDLGRRATAYRPSLPGDAHEPDGCFDASFMQRSLALTLGNLRRDSVEHVMLHESYAAPAAEVIAFLERTKAEGVTRHVGVANSAVHDPALRSACPPGWSAQAAVHPAMLLEPTELPSPVILHSLLGTDRWLRSNQPGYAQAADRALEPFRGLGAGETMRALLPYCLAADHTPAAGLIYATTELARLNAVLRAAAAIDRGEAAPAIAAAFRAAYAEANEPPAA